MCQDSRNKIRKLRGLCACTTYKHSCHTTQKPGWLNSKQSYAYVVGGEENGNIQGEKVASKNMRAGQFEFDHLHFKVDGNLMGN